MIANTYVVKPFGISEVKVIALKGEPGDPTQEQVNTAVEEYMDDHPESQIPDGSVSMSKLSSDVAENVSDVPNKANQTGSYPDLIAGTAENLLSSSYQTNRTPYIIRRTPYGARERGSIVGGSIVWNQLVKDEWITSGATTYGLTITNNGDGTVTVNGTVTDKSSTGTPILVYIKSALGTSFFHCIKDHKYLYLAPKLPEGVSGYNVLSGSIAAMGYKLSNGSAVFNCLQTADTYAYGRLESIQNGATFNNYKYYFRVFDLTLMFGPTIADYIYTQEQATAGAGVALAKACAGITADYNPYDAGSIKSVTGLTSHKMTGKNLFPVDSATSTRAQNIFNNYAISLPAGTYTLSFKSNVTRAANMSVSFTMSNGELASQNITPSMTSATFVATARITDITWYVREASNISEIQLEFGSTATEYEPYTAHTYPLDSSLTLRGLLKLDGDNLYYDGDIYRPSGEGTKRYFLTDLGTLNYSAYDVPNGKAFVATITGAKTYGNSYSTNVITTRYTEDTSQNNAYYIADKTFKFGGSYFGTSKLTIVDSSYTDAATFKAAMSGVILQAELATPESFTAEPYTELQICDPTGTEEWVGASMPVGHETKYYADLKGKLEDIPDAPTTSGTYVLKATVSSSGVTYSWVEG